MAHSWKPKKDPLKDREAALDAQKHLPGKYPSKFLPDREPKQQIDEFYTPHKGKVKK